MESLRTCDVLVVGAGPAGCSAGLSVKARGLDVVICERKAVVGVPVRCAEHIPVLLKSETCVEPTAVIQTVRAMKTILPDGRVIENKAPGYMIRRDLFDQGLARQCRENGVQIITDARVLGVDNECVIISLGGKTLRIKAKVIIGADGPRSTVGRWMNSVNKDLIPAVQARVPLVASMDFTEVYFLKEIVGGYGWLFPKGGDANAGLGMIKGGDGRSLYKALRDFLSFLEGLKKIDMKTKGCMAGWIPVRPLQRTVSGNMLLVGDAAGQTHPITGAGVPQAVICGKMAGEWAARAAAEDNIEILYGYEEEWKDLFLESLERGVQRRKIMEERWDCLDRILPFCWVGFKEYYGRLHE
ncbi:MAG: geranylgeranyl reductase family protein [Desulfobacteraceae bacterium]|jgi:geranylgeranyl reductase family protein|nr:MAG: geranylgeranyl reductase family protein [Desulfobacteraceae bacterium]